MFTGPTPDYQLRYEALHRHVTQTPGLERKILAILKPADQPERALQQQAIDALHKSEDDLTSGEYHRLAAKAYRGMYPSFERQARELQNANLELPPQTDLEDVLKYTTAYGELLWHNAVQIASHLRTNKRNDWWQRLPIIGTLSIPYRFVANNITHGNVPFEDDWLALLRYAKQRFPAVYKRIEQLAKEKYGDSPTGRS